MMMNHGIPTTKANHQYNPYLFLWRFRGTSITKLQISNVDSESFLERGFFRIQQLHNAVLPKVSPSGDWKIRVHPSSMLQYGLIEHYTAHLVQNMRERARTKT